MQVEKFLLTHPWIGWIAFFVALGIFLIFVLLQYLLKSRLTKGALSSMKNAQDTESAKENLVLPSSDIRAYAEYHKICSDDETPGLNDSIRSTPSYLVTLQLPRASRLPINRRKESFVGHYNPQKNNWKPGWPREALRQIYPSDISSVGSESSRSYGRPLSYREMRRSTPSSPSILSPYTGF
jgi:hypothetical protein